jgi:hypothetical protein
MHIAGDFRLRQCLDDELSFPRAVTAGLPMLDRAASADTKMLTEWRDAFRACTLDLDQAPSVGMVTWHRGDFDGLAAERIGYKECLAAGVGDTVAEVADMIDGQTLNHGARR